LKAIGNSRRLKTWRKNIGGIPNYDSHLVRRTHEIRKLPLAELTNGDIAMMIRQKFSLKYFVPLAIEKLENDILAYGDNGDEGEIMDALLKVSADFWKSNTGHWSIIKKLLDDNASVWTFKRDSFDSVNQF
jgi:hypothetical protein